MNDPKAKVKWFKDGNQLEVRSNLNSMHEYRGGRGDKGSGPPPEKLKKNIGFLSNIGLDLL